MLINERPLQHWLDNFYGYGSWQAPIWYIGYEDGGGDLPEEVAEKLDYFYNLETSHTKPTLVDIRDLYKHATYRDDNPKAHHFGNLYEHRFGNKALLNGSWKNLIVFTHGYHSEPQPDLLKYQKKSLHRPKPAVRHGYRCTHCPVRITMHGIIAGWKWLDLIFLKSRALYEGHVYERRIQTILSNIRQHKPRLVLMYGMNNINVLKASVQEFFPAAKFAMVKAIKLSIPQHHRANLDGTTLVITTQMPTLKHNRIETGFDWEVFGKLVVGT